MKFVLTAATTILMAAALPASAGGWEALSTNDAGAPVRIAGTSSNGLGAVLVCSPKGKITAVMSTDEVDLSDALRSVPTVSKNKSGDVVVGDDDPYRARLTHWSSRDLLITRKYKTGAKIFNGIVRGDPITIKLLRGEELKYDLPSADETFGAFATACKSNRQG